MWIMEEDKINSLEGIIKCWEISMEIHADRANSSEDKIKN